MSRSVRACIELLAAYYQRTYSTILGFDRSVGEWVLRLEAVAAAMRAVKSPNPSPRCQGVATALAAYRRGSAQQERLRPLLDLLENRQAPTRVLDYGCSDLAALDELKARYPLRILVGLDVEPAPTTAAPDGEVVVVNTLDEIPRELSFDLVTAIFVLHHMPAQEHGKTLSRLRRLLTTNGVLYVVEDDPFFTGPVLNRADEDFLRLPLSERVLLAELNDYWSNVVIYERSSTDQYHAFRPPEGWTALARHYGLRMLASIGLGFNYKRLHGVPSTAMAFSTHHADE